MAKGKRVFALSHSHVANGAFPLWCSQKLDEIGLAAYKQQFSLSENPSIAFWAISPVLPTKSTQTKSQSRTPKEQAGTIQKGVLRVRSVAGLAMLSKSPQIIVVSTSNAHEIIEIRFSLKNNEMALKCSMAFHFWSQTPAFPGKKVVDLPSLSPPETHSQSHGPIWDFATGLQFAEATNIHFYLVISVDGWNPANQLRLVVYTFFYKVL